MPMNTTHAEEDGRMFGEPTDEKAANSAGTLEQRVPQIGPLPRVPLLGQSTMVC